MDRYIERNVHQCWNCKNQISEKELSFRLDGKVKTEILPECKVADKYMAYVYSNPCTSFIPKQ